MLAPHKAGEACKNRGSDHGQAGAFYRTWGGVQGRNAHDRRGAAL